MDKLHTRLPGDHSDDVLTIAPDERLRAKTKIESTTFDLPQLSITKSPAGFNVSNKQTGPAFAGEISALDAPSLQVAPAPSEKSFELMNQLEALARDFASSQHVSPDQRTDKSQEEPDLAPKVEVEPTIHVPPRSDDFGIDAFRSDGPSTGRRIVSTVFSLFVAAILGLGAAFAWQSYRFWTAVSPSEVEQAASVAPGRASPAQAAPIEPNALANASTAPSAPATAPAAPPTTAPAAPNTPTASPELQRQLETMAQDLAVVRRGMEEVAAKQGQLASFQQQLEQLSAAQQQLTAKQEQLAQNIAKLQAVESTRRKVPPPQTRPVSAAPQRATSASASSSVSPSAAPTTAVSPPPSARPEAAAQATAAPRSSNQPVPPLPVPPDYRSR
ncbi:MAG TPA: hypothetical protein VI077_02680 [Pseudolabrys sp.]